MKKKNSVKNKCSGQKVTRANRKDRKKILIKKKGVKDYEEKVGERNKATERDKFSLR